MFKTKIKLEENDCALVITGKGELKLFFPKFEKDEKVSDKILLLTVLAKLITEEDEEFQKIFDRKCNELLDKFEKLKKEKE